VLVLLFLALPIILGVLIYLGGEAGAVALGAANILPLALLAVLAQLGNQRRWARGISWFLVALAFLTLTLLTAMLTLMAQGGLSDFADSSPLPPGAGRNAAISAGFCLLLLLGTAPLLSRSLRQGLSRVTPLKPDRFTSTVALWLVVYTSLVLLVPLVVLGVPPLLEIVARTSDQNTQKEVLYQMFYPLIWLIPSSFLAVGLGVNRDFKEALERLGLRGLTLSQVGFAVVMALALIAAVQLLSPPQAVLWDYLGLAATDATKVEKLFADMITPFGVIALSVTAGVGEELTFRGVLQPRLGVFLANLLFANVHAWQYGSDGLAMVFFVGLVLGILRKRTNTLTAVIVHGTYDLGLTTLALFEAM